MKNGLLIWNVILSLVAGYLLFAQFSSKKNSRSTNMINTVNDTSSLNRPVRIAYFEMDSIEANFEMVKEVKKELNDKEELGNKEMDELLKQYQQKYLYYQQQAQEGKMSQTESEAANQEMKDMNEKIKARKQELDIDYNDYRVRRQTDIKSTIEGFIKEYNKEKGYSFIVTDDTGLFYYKDSAYNITPDVVKGLNELHRPGKKEKTK